jgi:hypothetical protein
VLATCAVCAKEQRRPGLLTCALTWLLRRKTFSYFPAQKGRF